ncbi:hypothetical protein AB1M41_19520 [Bacillus inaquosorum]|uniref:hypothetical protein n=1 Tax=Bacillus inaquosorum TaxID=483913 RepID=UPI0034CE9642
MDILDEFFHQQLLSLDTVEFIIVNGYLSAEMFLTVSNSYNSDERLAINEELIDHFDVEDIELLEVKVVFLN